MNRTSHIPQPEFDFTTHNNSASREFYEKHRDHFNAQVWTLFFGLMEGKTYTRLTAQDEHKIADPIKRFERLRNQYKMKISTKKQGLLSEYFCSPSDREHNEGVFVRLFGG